jgi:PAT family beta-lactamase induction signal transducer AmpG
VLLGPVVDRFGAKLALMLAVLVRAVVFGAVGFMEFLWQDPLFLKVGILISYLSGQVVTIAIISLFMQISFQRVAATQFAVYMALANLSLSMGSALIAPMDGVLSYSQMFYVMATLNVLFLLLWPLFNLVRHRSDLQGLESNLNRS